MSSFVNTPYIWPLMCIYTLGISEYTENTMTEVFSEEPILPRVTPEDLARILFEDVTEPSHIQRWHDFADANPLLARDILERARSQVSTSGKQRELSETQKETEQIKAFIDLVSYAVRALEEATKRIRSSGGAVDVVNPQPLA
jgi:hypothetical protein